MLSPIKSQALLAGFALLTLSRLSCCGEPPEGPPKVSAAISNPLAEAARKCYESALAKWNEGRIGNESLCLWSMRWQEAAGGSKATQAERQAASQSHLERLRLVEEQAKKRVQEAWFKEMRKKVEQRVQAGRALSLDASEAEFRELELEQRLAAEDKDDAALEKLRAQMQVLAKSSFEKSFSLWKEGDQAVPFRTERADRLESLYCWSTRWAEAEIGLAKDMKGRTASQQGHQARMNAVQERAHEFAKAPQSSFTLLAAQYFVLEAAEEKRPAQAPLIPDGDNEF